MHDWQLMLLRTSHIHRSSMRAVRSGVEFNTQNKLGRMWQIVTYRLLGSPSAFGKVWSALVRIGGSYVPLPCSVAPRIFSTQPLTCRAHPYHGVEDGRDVVRTSPRTLIRRALRQADQISLHIALPIRSPELLPSSCPLPQCCVLQYTLCSHSDPATSSHGRQHIRPRCGNIGWCIIKLAIAVPHRRYPARAEGLPAQVPLRTTQCRERGTRHQDQQAKAHHGGGRAV